MAKKQILGHSGLLVSPQTGAIALLAVFATQSVTKTWAWSPAPKVKAKLDIAHLFPALRKQKQADAGTCRLASPA